MNRKGFSAAAIILTVVIILIAAGGIWYFEMHNTKPSLAAPTQNATTTTSSTTSVGTTTPGATNSWLMLPSSPIVNGIVNDQGGCSPDNEDDQAILCPQNQTSTLPEAVYEQINSGSWDGNDPRENISSLDMPFDPVNSSTIFISTVSFVLPSSTASSGAIDTINNIYAYNLGTSALLKIYTESDQNNAPGDTIEGRLLRTVGIDGSKLILLVDSPGNSGGPCGNIWSDFVNQMVYLELSNISEGLQPYQVPQYKYNEASSSEQQCIQEMYQSGGS